MRIGIFGGSFDPIHNGHIALLKAFDQQLAFDKILVIPAFVSPFKQQNGAALPQQRLTMCQLAFADCPTVEVSDIELRREGPSYTADTLQTLSALYPDSELFLLTGADAFLSLQDWKDPSTIFRLAAICTIPRDGADITALQHHADFLHTLGARTVIADVRVMKVSSTEVRTRIRAGQPLDGLVPSAVEQYIIQNGLYPS